MKSGDWQSPLLELDAVVLAGGKSRRMGADKAFLQLEERPLIAWVVEVVRPLVSEVIIVANDTERYAAFSDRVVPDEIPDVGSLGGLYSGLRAARHTWCLAVACDMPFLSPKLLRYMAGLREAHDAVVPVVGDYPQPLHALYRRSCAEPIGRRLFAGERKMISFYPDVRVCYVREEECAHLDPYRLSFFNANTPEEWEEALRLLRQLQR